jgi:hypothetical protein
MNQKRKTPLDSARRGGSAIPAPARVERRLPASTGLVPADSAIDFYERQTRTDEAIRTIPGLRDFGK